MKQFLSVIIPYAIAGGIMATIARLYHYTDHRNKEKIERREDGTIHWKWLAFENITKVMVAMSASIFVGVVIIPHLTVLDEYSKLAITGFSAIVGEQIYNIIGYKLKNFVDKWMMDGHSVDGSEPQSNDRRRNRRNRGSH